MTQLATGLSTDIKGVFAAMQGRVYFANDFDTQKVWNPPGSAVDAAGISAPAAAIGAPTAAAGNCTNGAHLVRYRYKNSRTGYYSNPSEAITVTVAGGNGQLTFDITASGGGGDIIRSTDAKVDTIVVEMTPVNSPTYYIAGTTLQTASTIVISKTDATLIQGTNVQAAISEDGFGHETPPLTSIIVSHKGRLFALGASTRTRTSVTLTNASATMSGTNFSTNWAGRTVIISGETTPYGILSVTNSTTLTLTATYGGSTSAAKTVYVVSNTPNRMYWTLPGFPEAWRADERARDCLQNRADEVRGAWSYMGDLFIFGKASCERLSYNTDPGPLEGTFIPVPGTRGCFNQQCLVEAEGVLYAWDRQGMYALAGGVPTDLSGDVMPTLLSLCDFDYHADFHAGYDPVDRQLLFFFVRSGETTPKYAAAYNLDAKEWSLISFRQGITASKAVPDSDGNVRLLLGDENGYTWYFGVDGSFDGVPPASATVVTTSGTPTQTSVTVTGTTLPTSPSLAGVVAYDPATGYTATVASNTGTVLTLTSPGFTSAPATATEIWLGSIHTELKSKWWSAAGAHDKKRPYLRLSLYPGTATGKLRIYLYKDFGASPVNVGTYSSVDGVTMATTYISVDLDGGSGEGYVDIPMPSDYARYWQWKIISDRPDGSFRLLNCEFVIKSIEHTTKAGVSAEARGE
jgi:hypothetical protein